MTERPAVCSEVLCAQTPAVPAATSGKAAAHSSSGSQGPRATFGEHRPAHGHKLQAMHQTYQHQNKPKRIQIKDNLESILFSLASKNMNKNRLFSSTLLQNQIKLLSLCAPTVTMYHTTWEVYFIKTTKLWKYTSHTA